MPITNDKGSSFAQNRTTRADASIEAPRRENATGAKYGAPGVLVVRNKSWTHVEFDRLPCLLTKRQGACLRVMAELSTADEFVLPSNEVTQLADLIEPKLSQVFRTGHPLIGRAFRYLRSPKGFIEVLINEVICCTGKTPVDPR